MNWKIILCLSSFILTIKAIQNELLEDRRNITDVVVIGGGPAGLVAATTAARIGGFHVLLVAGEIGGQLLGAQHVSNMPGILGQSGVEIVENLVQQAQEAGVIFLNDLVKEIDFQKKDNFFFITTENGKQINARSVIIATGAAPRRLNVSGEDDYWGHGGVYSCASCDFLAVKELNAAVVGGGDSAIEQALILAPYAKKITIFVRKNRMRAVESMQKKLQNLKNVEIIYNKEIVKIIGNGQKITALEIQDNESKEIMHFPTDGLFLAIGHNPNSGLFVPYFKLLDQGYIELDSRSQQTKIPGIFVAGEIAESRFRQAQIVCAQGMQAAIEATEYLTNQGITSRTHYILKENYFSA